MGAGAVVGSGRGWGLQQRRLDKSLICKWAGSFCEGRDFVGGAVTLQPAGGRGPCDRPPQHSQGPCVRGGRGRVPIKLYSQTQGAFRNRQSLMTGSRLMVARGWGGRYRECLLNGYEVLCFTISRTKGKNQTGLPTLMESSINKRKSRQKAECRRMCVTMPEDTSSGWKKVSKPHPSLPKEGTGICSRIEGDSL